MKYFPTDWSEALDQLPRYLALSPGARRVVLAMRPSQGAGPTALGPFRDELLESGFVVPKGSGATVIPADAVRVVHTVLRAADRRRLWDDPTPGALMGYVEEHFTTEEMHATSGLRGWNFAADRADLTHMVTSVEWVESFLLADTRKAARAWESAHAAGSERRRFDDQHSWVATRRVVESLLAAPAPVPLASLAGHVPDVQTRDVATGLEAALRYLLVFLSLRGPECEPVVWVWPQVRARLGAPPPERPEAVEPAESFEAAWLMEDMTAVLAQAAGEPIRLRGSDQAIFAAARKAIEERMITVPDWTEIDGLEAEKRVEHAADVLRLAGYARRSGRSGQDLSLEPTKAGMEWLAASTRDRLAALVDLIRTSKARRPGTWYEEEGFEFFPVRLSADLPKTMDLRKWLTESFLGLPGEPVRVLDFLAYASERENPFLEALRDGTPLRIPWHGRRPTRHDWERLWGQILLQFLNDRLAPLGGARMGRTADGWLTFVLTDAGRYLLGAAKTFAYGTDAQAEVIVQPNFDVVFLAADPRLEAQFARLAQRVGTGPGVMFRLTRASVLAAAESGISAAQLLDTLRAASSRALPANVERQVSDWLGAVRRVQLRPTLLLECPDPETAARAMSAAGKQVRAITETVLELPGATTKDRNALVKKLRAQGVFVS
ncbi:MAG TPA: helicase-associated domain-containing protein [Longimicrobium sp.]|uniref:helicase-associated domain-containing protein n=1 Tax=Longimicrobium sp. TaxID=2029185 RepID=UPI002ED96F1E